MASSSSSSAALVPPVRLLSLRNLVLFLIVLFVYASPFLCRAEGTQLRRRESLGGRRALLVLEDELAELQPKKKKSSVAKEEEEAPLKKKKKAPIAEEPDEQKPMKKKPTLGEDSDEQMIKKKKSVTDEVEGQKPKKKKPTPEADSEEAVVTKKKKPVIDEIEEQTPKKKPSTAESEGLLPKQKNTDNGEPEEQKPKTKKFITSDESEVEQPKKRKFITSNESEVEQPKKKKPSPEQEEKPPKKKKPIAEDEDELPKKKKILTGEEDELPKKKKTDENPIKQKKTSVDEEVEAVPTKKKNPNAEAETEPMKKKPSPTDQIKLSKPTKETQNQTKPTKETQNQTKPTKALSISSPLTSKKATQVPKSQKPTAAEDDDLIAEFRDLPSKFQSDIQRISTTSKAYLNKANKEISQSFRPLVGSKYASIIASASSYIFILVPLLVLPLLYGRIRNFFLPLQTVLIFVQIYLAIYFSILSLSFLVTGMEPLKVYFATSKASYVYTQVLQTLAYVLYLLLQVMYLVAVFSTKESGPGPRFVGLVQMLVGLVIGTHYYVSVAHRAVLREPPRTNWKVHAIYAACFAGVCILARAERRKKAYLQEGGEDGKRS